MRGRVCGLEKGSDGGMKTKGLSGSTLKIIAVVTMIIDHIAAAVLWRFVLARGNSAVLAGASEGLLRVIQSENLLLIYRAMRNVGRIAFPIFCFLLIEGFEHTRDVRKYVVRLGLFALLSEVPFDLAFHGKLLEFTYQNVFFTLFAGLVTVVLFHAVEEYLEINPALRVFLLAVVSIGGMYLAHAVHTDYAARGVMCILVFYIFRKNKQAQIIAGVLAFFWWEPAAVFAFVPIALYNGARGIRLKYAFYAVYPIHLLILYALSALLGLGAIAVV